MRLRTRGNDDQGSVGWFRESKKGCIAICAPGRKTSKLATCSTAASRSAERRATRAPPGRGAG
eukprot:2003641-Pyramimonas_sp.AAC.1